MLLERNGQQKQNAHFLTRRDFIIMTALAVTGSIIGVGHVELEEQYNSLPKVIAQNELKEILNQNPIDKRSAEIIADIFKMEKVNGSKIKIIANYSIDEIHARDNSIFSMIAFQMAGYAASMPNKNLPAYDNKASKFIAVEVGESDIDNTHFIVIPALSLQKYNYQIVRLSGKSLIDAIKKCNRDPEMSFATEIWTKIDDKAFTRYVITN